MKLVNADALKDALFQKHVHDVEELESMLYLDDAMKVVDEAPTVDAIPISWIISWCFKRYMETEVEVSVPNMIEAWWKEREG